jgi:hypothetical protein
MSKLTFPLVIALVTVQTGAPRAQTASDVPNLAGAWQLDSYLTDNPEQVAAALRIDTGSMGSAETASRGDNSGGGGYGRGGRRGGLGGGSGRRGGGLGNGREQSGMSAQDRSRLDHLTEMLRYPPSTLTISQTEKEIVIRAAEDTVRTIHPNGKSEGIKLDGDNIDQKATFEGSRLRVSYSIGHAGTLIDTYRIDPVSRQLVISANFAREHEVTGPFEIKLVYNPAPAK